MTAGLLGRDVTVTTPDGRRLRAMVAGDGDDLVVLEAGLGGSGLTWGLVHAILARTHRVVAAFPHRRLVLVGHSWGGPIVRVAAARRIAQGLATAGVVLVDPSDERARAYASPAARIGFGVQAALLVPLARLGLLRRLHRIALAGLPEPLHAAAAGAAGSVRAARATAAEQRHLLPGLAALVGSGSPLPDIPVRVISGTAAGPLTRGQRRDLVRAHRASAAAFEQGAWIPAPSSEHMVPVTDPDVVAAAITALL